MLDVFILDGLATNHTVEGCHLHGSGRGLWDDAFHSAYPLSEFAIDHPAEGYCAAPAFTLVLDNGEVVSTAANGRAKMLVFINAKNSDCSCLINSLTGKSYPAVDIYYINANWNDSDRQELLNLIGTADFPTANNPGRYAVCPDGFDAMMTLKCQAGLEYYSVPSVFLVNAENQLVFGVEGFTSNLDKVITDYLVNENAPAAPEPVVYDADAVGLCGDNAVWRYSSDGTLTISGSGPLWDSEIDFDIAYGNTEIDSSDIQSVIVESGISSIGEGAFYGCTGLTGITIPDSVTNIGASAFSGCTGLTTLNYNGTMAQWRENVCIGDWNDPLYYAQIVCSDGKIGIVQSSHANFGTCGEKLIWSMDDAGTLTVFGEGNMTDYDWYSPWSDNSNIKSVVLENGVTSIGDNAFDGCTGLTSITIPDSVTNIGASAFSGCSGLTGITIPDSVTSIGDWAFSGCAGLTSITIGNGVTSFDGLFFSSYTNLSSVTIGSGLTSIGDWMFYGLTSLTSVTIGNGVTSIGEGAFYGCTGLTSVTIPASVTSIGGWAFYGCPKLTLRVYANSHGENYAIEHEIPYSIVGPKHSLSKADIIVSAQTYTGKALTPSVTVKLNGKTLKKGTDYTVEYKNNINAGTATVTITGKGNYTATKSATFQIRKAAQTMTASAPSSVLVGKTAKVTAKGVGKLTYKSSNTKIATVSTSGVVTGKGAGTVTITVTAAGDANRNAASKTVKLTVNLPTPTISKLENVNGGVKITVGKVTGAAKYRIFYKTGNGKWTKLADTESTTYTWKKAASGTTYAFTVRCISKDGKACTSDYNTTGKSILYLAVPTLANSAAKTLKATWKSASGVTGYQVSYAASSSFSGAKTVTVKNAKTLTTTIKNLKKGTTYYIRFRTYTTKSGKTTYSTWSGAKSIKLSK